MKLGNMIFRQKTSPQRTNYLLDGGGVYGFDYIIDYFYIYR